MGFLNTIIDTLRALFINVPLDNALSGVYVILNLILQLLALPFGGGSPFTLF